MNSDDRSGPAVRDDIVSPTGRARPGWRALRRVWLVGGFVAVFSWVLVLPAAASGRVIHSEKYGFSLRLPPGWTPVSLNGGDISGILGAVSKDNPTLGAALNQQVRSAAEKGLKFFAISPVSKSAGVDANLNIAITPGSASVDAIDASVKIDLTSAGFMNVQTRQVRYGFGRAIEASYTVPLGSNPSQTSYGTQFYATHGGRLYVVTFSSLSRPLESNAASGVMPTWSFR